MAVLILLALALATAVWLWRGRLLKDAWWWWGWAVLAAALVALAWIVVADRDKVLLKTLARLAMPAGLLWLLLLGVAGSRWAGGRRWSAARWTLLAAFYTATGNAWVGGWLMRGLEDRVAARSVATAEALDAVVVLGGGTSPAPDGSPQLGSAGDRIAVGAELAIAGKAPFLVTTGASIAGIAEPRDLSADTRALWRALGIADERIVGLATPENTREEIAAVKALAEARGWTRLGLVTSAWHLPRVLAHCRRAGLAVVPIAADRRGRIEPPNLIWLIPTELGFQRVQLACTELLGLATGR